MTPRTYVTEKVTSELLHRVLTTLSSLTNTLPKEDQSTIVSAVQKLHKDKEFLSNNDLGIVVRRLTSLMDHKNYPDVSLEQRYDDVRTDDDMSTEMLTQLAYNLSSVLSRQLLTLRDTLPNEAQQIIALSQQYLPQEKEALMKKPDVVPFTWGRLNDSTYQHGTMLYCREVANAFRSSSMRAYDATHLLEWMTNRYPGELKKLSTESLAKVSEVLKGQYEDTASVEAFVNDIQSNRTFNLFKNTTVKTMSGSAEDTVLLVSTLTRVGEYSRYTEALLNKGIESLVEADTLRHNLLVANDVYMLIHGAALVQKETHFKDSLILPSNDQKSIPVNASLLDKFRQDGGSLEDIQNVNRYNEIKGFYVSRRGVSLERVLALKDEAKDTVTKDDVEKQKKSKVQDMDAQDSAMAKALDEFHSSSETFCSNPHDHDERHQHNKKMVLRKLGKPNTPQDKLIIEYRLNLRKNPLLTMLYKNCDEEFNTFMDTAATESLAITQKTKDTMIAKAVLKTVMTFISDNFMVEA